MKKEQPKKKSLRRKKKKRSRKKKNNSDTFGDPDVTVGVALSVNPEGEKSREQAQGLALGVFRRVDVKLIVGLGNPGNRYTKTRHNIGYRVVKKIAENYGIEFKRSFLTRSLISKTQIGSEQVILVLPLTFMNLSGRAISKIVKRNNIVLEDILVVCDDIDSPFGKMKIRPSGSDGGHQGLRSIMEALTADGVNRLKIGIGRPQNKEEVVNYVLSDFNKEEESSLIELVDRAVACCEVWLESGIEKAMNEFK